MMMMMMMIPAAAAGAGCDAACCDKRSWHSTHWADTPACGRYMQTVANISSSWTARDAGARARCCDLHASIDASQRRIVSADTATCLSA